MASLSSAKAQAAQDVPFRIRDLLALTIWFGVAAGLLDGIAFLILQTAGWVTWNMKESSVDQNILWASSLMDLTIFLIVGLGLLAVFLLLRPARWMFWAIVVFGSIGCYALVSIPGRLRERGAMMLALGLATVLARVMTRDAAAWMERVRRSVVALLLVAIVIGIAAAGGDVVWEKYQESRLPPPPAGAPNVLFIVMDTMRMDRLGAYGYSRPTTPFLDSYAGKAVLFEKAFVNAPWTLPSHVTFFTGRMPFEHGATLEPFDGRVKTIAEVMAGRGYATVGIAANNAMATRLFGIGRGFHKYVNIFTHPRDAAMRTLYGRKLQKWVLARFFPKEVPQDHMRAADVNQRFLRWLEQRPGRPFFAFLNYMEMHLPNDPSEEFMQQFAKDRPLISFAALRHQHPFDPREVQRLNNKYDALAASLDAELKRLFDELGRRRLEQNLLVIITSDHGESLGEHQLIGHWIGLYMEELRVPLLIRMPGKTPEGIRVAEPVSLHALPATIMEMTGGASGEFPGQPLSACWTGGKCGEPMILGEVSKGYSPDLRKHWPIWQGWVKSLIADQWHLIVQQDGKMELYDWHGDPSEAQDLAGTREGQDVVKVLTEKLEAWVPEARERAAQPSAEKRH
jgi:arylsulfatase A-like enzyme